MAESFRRDKQLTIWKTLKYPMIKKRNEMEQGSHGRLHILSLPPEIRVAIIEYVLIEPDKIEVRERLRPPPLLGTCRQLRQNAGLIWFERNKFLISIWDCNASIFAAFADLHRKHQRRYNTNGHLVYNIVIEGRKNFHNLALWCFAVWENRIPAYKMLEPSDDFEAFVSVATNIAKWHRHRPWEECYATLDAVRYALGKYDVAWIESRDCNMGKESEIRMSRISAFRRP